MSKRTVLIDLRIVNYAPEAIHDKLIESVAERIHKRFGLDPVRDLHVLTTMNRSTLGTRALTSALQARLNAMGAPDARTQSLAILRSRAVSAWWSSSANRWAKNSIWTVIEHGLIRAPGVYDEPRIHYVAARLAGQLEEQVVRFLSDRSRNRYDAAAQTLEVSEIFDWYREDFSSGFQGIRSREQFFAQYAELLTDDPGGQTLIRSQRAKIRFVDYDWALNDFRGCIPGGGEI